MFVFVSFCLRKGELSERLCDELDQHGHYSGLGSCAALSLARALRQNGHRREAALRPPRNKTAPRQRVLISHNNEATASETNRYHGPLVRTDAAIVLCALKSRRPQKQFYKCEIKNKTKCPRYCRIQLNVFISVRFDSTGVSQTKDCNYAVRQLPSFLTERLSGLQVALCRAFLHCLWLLCLIIVFSVCVFGCCLVCGSEI
jgi:hypothetical protein